MQVKVEDTTIADAADTELGTFDVSDLTEGVFTIVNEHATRAFDVFKILTRTHSDAPQITAASAAADFTTAPKDPVLYGSGSPVTLAAEASVNLRINLVGIAEISFVAQGNGGTSTASIYGCCN